MEYKAGDEYKINLSKNQRKKIETAYNKKIPVSLQLKPADLSNGSYSVFLTQKQITKIEKSKKDKKGCRITLTYDQLKQNHSGGFLPLLFAGLGALGALAGGGAAIANSVINKKAKDKELEEQKRHNKAMEGKGLRQKKRNNSVVQF